MNWGAIKKRLSDVAQIDVMSADKADFLATHMPFENLTVQESGHESSEAIHLSEEAVFQSIISNPQNEHRFVIVKGRNGAGKSHLIRWFEARMRNDLKNAGRDDEKIIFIRRIDNSLRGAMRQLLEQDVIEDSEQKERMEQFVSSVDSRPEGEIKSTIYYSFLTLIENEQDDSVYKPAERRRLANFLKCTPVQDYLLQEGGVIDRYYELIAKPRGGAVNATEPSFTAEDFTGMRSLMRVVARDFPGDAKLMLGQVMQQRGAEKLAGYLNGYSHTVIQRCANLTQGDADTMIRQLRARLKSEGRNLTVFIEDMTTFTGIDSDLVKVLSVKHGGEYADLCRVTAVIGLTDAYYETCFRGNFQDRVTHQISLGEDSFGTPETLKSLAARYINAIYLEKNETEQWLNSGALFTDLPYKAYEPEYTWDRVTLEGREFSLFPFTAKALVELYGRLAEKTPRFFISRIIQTQMTAYINMRLQQSIFPATTVNALGQPTLEFTQIQHDAQFSVAVAQWPEKRAKALRTLLCIWGNATLYQTHKENGEPCLAELPMAFLREVGFAESLPSLEQDGSNGSAIETAAPPTPEAGPAIVPQKTEFEKALEKHILDIKGWFQQNAKLDYSEDRRKDVYDFLHDTVLWQDEGVPVYWLQFGLGSSRQVYIEGQVQRAPTKEEASIVLERTEEVYYVLLGLTYRHFYKSWSFPDSAFYQLRCAVWLESHKAEFVKRVSGATSLSMKQILACCMNVEFIRIAMFGGLARTEHNLFNKLFLAEKLPGVKDDRGDAWQRLAKNLSNAQNEQFFENNKQALTRMINVIMGESKAAKTPKYLVRRTEIDEVYTTLSRQHWNIEKALLLDESPTSRRQVEALKWLKEYVPKVEQVLDQECERLTDIIEKLGTYIADLDKPESWTELTRKIAEFLRACNDEYHLLYPDELKSETAWIQKSAQGLSAIVRNAPAIKESDSFGQKLAFFSSDPCAELQRALTLYSRVNNYAISGQEDANRRLEGSRVTVQSNESMANLRKRINDLYDLLESLGGDINAD